MEILPSRGEGDFFFPIELARSLLRISIALSLALSQLAFLLFLLLSLSFDLISRFRRALSPFFSLPSER